MGDINERIRELRYALEISQNQFAKRIFISQSLLADIELGNQSVNNRMAHLISLEFGVSKNWLATGIGDMFVSEKPDIRLETMIDIFNQLDSELQDYLLSQARWIFKLKNDRMDKKQT